MKKSFLRIVSAFALLFFSSCAKHGLLRSGNTIDNCRITSITDTDTYFSADTLTFYYNSDGSPSHVSSTNIGDNSPQYFFRYDNQSRLLDYIAAYANGAGIAWTRYYYNEVTRTVIDTLYTLVQQYVTWPPTFFGNASSDLKQYDELGRIISDKHTQLYPTQGVDTSELTSTQTYTYNEEGNVEGYQYDNKIDIHRTNRVWQFVDNDYSNNNVLPIEQYNAYGLPTKIANNGYNPFLVSLELPTLIIHYSCDAPLRK